MILIADEEKYPVANTAIFK